MKTFLVLLEGSKGIASFNGRIKYSRDRSIKIVQPFEELVKLEDVIQSSVDKYGRFIVGIHGNFEMTGNINKCQKCCDRIWVVKTLNGNISIVPDCLWSKLPPFVNLHIAVLG